MKTPWQHRKICGFTLAEVVIAVGVITFGLVGVYSLLPAGLRSFQDSKNETLATELLAVAAIDLRATPRTSGGTSHRFAFQPFLSDPGAHTIPLRANGTTAASREEAEFLLTATPIAAGLPHQVPWRLRVEWPARAEFPTDSVETVVMLHLRQQP